jgi:hypothetical protein
MNDADRGLWPFGRRASLISAAVLLVGLLLLVAVLRAILGWPSAQSENTVLIGVLLLSLLPVLLAFLDIIIERGAVIEYGSIKVDFSQSREMGITGITVAANIGVRGQAVTDTSTTQILDALKKATASDVVIIDLEEGQAWWETRLLVLLAGAERLKKPEKIVFVGMDARKEQRFQGWSYASDLLPRLVRAHPQYGRSLQAARAAARQWELVEPVNPVIPGTPPVPMQPPWLSGTLATRYPWMAFDVSTGAPNELLAEQLLASDLGEKVELQEGSRSISLVRLEELFRPVLNKECIDLSWTADRQLSTFLDLDTEVPSIAVTNDGKYSTLVSRLTLLNEVLKSLLKGRERR